MIPRIVHMIWIGPREFPYQDHLESFRALNPAWQVRLWTNDTLPDLGENTWIYQRLTNWAVKADLVRLHLLRDYGGVYSDADSRCAKPLDELVKGKSLCAMTGKKGNAANGTLASTRGHPALKRMVAQATDHYRDLRKQQGRKRWVVHDVFGGRYFRGIAHEYPDFHVWGRELVCSHREDVSRAFVVHHSENSWKKELGKRGRITLR